ncbi:hypothetical protein ACWEGQ_03675 [Streptomyces seoulensis]
MSDSDRRSAVVSVRRVVFPLVIWVAMVPWLFATVTTTLWGFSEASNGPALTFGTRMVLVPLLLVGEVVGVVAVFRPHDGLRSDFWPGAALAFALLALFTVTGVSATWDAWGGPLWIWALYSGYVFFVFGFGGMAWKKVFASASASSSESAEASPSRRGRGR